MITRPNRSDPFRLDGRMALVTGASGFLGRAVALGLAEAGATLLLSGRAAAKLDALCADAQARGTRAVPVPLDDAGRKAMGVFFDGFGAAGGRLDILVNSDMALPAKDRESVGGGDFLAATEAAIARPFELVRAATPFLERAAALRGHASVINIASPAGGGHGGAHGPDTELHAGAARAGMLEMTRHLARRLASRGIRVNAVLPGALLTPAMEAARPDLAEELKRQIPLGRLGGPQEVAHAVRFLAGDAAGYITGAAIPVDGGYAIR